MNGPGDYTESDRERQVDGITYMRNLKYGSRELNYKTDAHTERRGWRLPRGWGGEERSWKSGVSRWINNKARLYSTGNYLQLPVINHEEDEYGKERHTCITILVLCSIN